MISIFQPSLFFYNATSSLSWKSITPNTASGDINPSYYSGTISGTGFLNAGIVYIQFTTADGNTASGWWTEGWVSSTPNDTSLILVGGPGNGPSGQVNFSIYPNGYPTPMTVYLWYAFATGGYTQSFDSSHNPMGLLIT